MTVLSEDPQEIGLSGKLSNGQVSVASSVRQGGCVLLSEIVDGLLDGRGVQTTCNVEAMALDAQGHSHLDFEFGDGPINSTRWRKTHLGGRYHIDGFAGYTSRIYDRETTWGKIAQLAASRADKDHSEYDGSSILVFDDHAWQRSKPLPQVTAAIDGYISTRVEHIFSSFDALGKIENSTAISLFKRHRDKLTVVVDLRDLRTFDGIIIGRSLSWERTFDDISRAVTSVFNLHTPAYACARVITLTDLCGAVIVERGGDRTLVFDKTIQEGDFFRRHPYPVFGYTSTFLATMVASLYLKGPAASVDGEGQGGWVLNGTKCGLDLMRHLHVYGFERVHGPKITFPYTRLSDRFDSWNVYFSTSRNKRVLTEVRRSSDLFEAEWDFHPEFTIPDSSLSEYGPASQLDPNGDPHTQELWTILKHEVQNPDSPFDTQAIYDTSRHIVRDGEVHALRNVPIERIGKWSSADRNEIEGVRAVKNEIAHYIENDQKAVRRLPLCLAVFGPPGSGKSFAITEIAEKSGIKREDILNFNLSQFTSSIQLIGAFHRVRDQNLRGLTPVVFWDEFDSRFDKADLGWLRYFLSPMQDGEFLEDGVSHPLGPAIFVFAGGTSTSYSEFINKVSPSNSKKTDFVSRLSAFINVKGPNGVPNHLNDPLVPIRRAFLVRNLLLDKFGKTHAADTASLDISSSVIDAFLRVHSFRHGSRSISKIIQISTLEDGRKFSLSSLPPELLLNMHTDSADFLDYALGNCSSRVRYGLEFNGEPTNTGASVYKKIVQKARKKIGVRGSFKSPSEERHSWLYW